MIAVAGSQEEARGHNSFRNMLQRLYILNYVLIDRLDIEFGPGFSVITGETGAGKSIMLGALHLLLGGRADVKAIRQGAAKCCVEATFDVSTLQLDTLFAEADIDFDGHECILRREVSANGKSRAFVNDSPVQVAFLKKIGTHLIDIHSQHRNLLLGEEEFLLDTLDAVGNHVAQLQSYHDAYDAWCEASHALKSLQEKARQDTLDTDYQQHCLDLLESAGLTDGEQELLEQESKALSHAEEIKSAFYGAAALLNGDERSLSSSLRAAAHALQGVSEVCVDAGALAERLDSLRIELDDIAGEVEQVSESLEFDPARQSFVDERLDTLYSLQHKFKVDTVAQLLQKAEELRLSLSQLEDIDAQIEAKKKEVAACGHTLQAKGEALRKAREQAGQFIASQLSLTLQTLGIPAATLRFSLLPRKTPGHSGLDNVVLLFSANRDMPPQDVSEIASGGEIARLMLALKTLMSGHRQLPTIVFDEIDTGVSGTMAERMALVMQEIGKRSQVLSITHLPQIAALGSRHYRVSKSEGAEGTCSRIDELHPEERIMEIAHMLSGAELTDAAVGNAKSLLRME